MSQCQLMKLWTEKLQIATKKKSTITLIIPAEVGSGHSQFCSYLLPLLDKILIGQSLIDFDCLGDRCGIGITNIIVRQIQIS